MKRYKFWFVLPNSPYPPPPNTGNKEITWMMLEAGAETDVVNSVGRTAAQMAAFVGKLKEYHLFLNP